MVKREADKEVSVWRRRVSFVVLGILVLILLTFLILLQSSQVWKYFQVDTASETLTLYALSSLNFFAFIIFAFIFLRSIVKLARERQAFQLGAKLKTRLLFYFIAVSLLPIMAMAVFSYLFLNRALEKWFSRLPETVIEEAREVQKQAVQAQLQRFDEKAKLVVLLIENTDEPDTEFLDELLEKGNLAAIEISSSNGAILARAEKNVDSIQKDELQKILQTLRERKYSDVKLHDGQEFDASFTQTKEGRQIFVVSNWRGEKTISEVISNSPFEFEKLKQQQAEVRQLGFSTLSLLTFLLIFAASWVALQIGRNITKPILALAEASNEVARGNLAYKIDVFAEDELAILVDSFNQMTAQLQENQRNLEERRNYIETILQTLSTGVISLDAENRITTINAAAREILRREDFSGENRPLAEIMRSEDHTALEKLILRARRLGQAAEQTVLFRGKQNENGNGDGETVPVSLMATALNSAQDEKRGVVLVIEDLTELINAQRAAAWQEVARRMAHEIKNPLTPIQLSAERIAKRFAENYSPKSKVGSFLAVFKDQKPKNEAQLAKVIDESTTTILREVNSLKLMVDEFSRYARLPHAKLEPGELNEIVRQTVDLYEDRLGTIKLEIDLANNLPAAMIDEEQLKRVFVNLMDNALEALSGIEGERKIIVKTAYDTCRDLLTLEIADTGNGIAAKDFSRVFQPYFSTKGRGTGLGLAIVQRIIAEHGGKIRAAHNLPKGAKFVVELPITNS